MSGRVVSCRRAIAIFKIFAICQVFPGTATYVFKIIYGLVHVLEQSSAIVHTLCTCCLLSFALSFTHLTAVLIMATLVSTYFFYSSCSKTLLSWTIYMPEDNRITVQGYYEMVVSKQLADVQEHMRDHILDEVRVDNTKDELDKMGNKYLK